MTNSAAVVRSTLDRVISGDATVFDDNPGLADVKKNAALIPAFPDLSQTVVQQVVEGDKVATHLILRGTHAGGLFGRTGKCIEFQFLSVVRLESERIAAYNSAVDWLAVLPSSACSP